MRVLLAVTRQSDPRTVSSCLAHRFNKQSVEIDVVTVVQGPEKAYRKRGAYGAAGPGTAAEVVADVAFELRHRHGFGAVRRHVECGDPVETLLAATARLRSDLILIEAPRGTGLLTAFRFDGVTRRLFGRARCPVELVRPQSGGGRKPSDVLIPIGLGEIDEFPGQQLRALPWVFGTRLHLLGVLSPAVESTRVEASSLAVLRSVREAEEVRARGEERLRALCESLRARGDIDADFRIVEGKTREVAVKCAQRTGAGLIVLASGTTDGGFRGMAATLSPEAIALSAACSVLLLRSNGVAVASQRHEHGSGVVSLLRS